MIPVIETKRLRLRGPEPEDEAGYLNLMQSERSQYVGGPLSLRRAWGCFAEEIGHWHIRGFGMWALTEHGSNDCLGFVGLWYPASWPEKEIGWLVWPEAEGKGYAFEAALASRDYAYKTLGWTTVVSYIDKDNTRSISLAKRLGAAHDPDAEKLDPEDLVFRHPSPEALR
jgi:RimJ/RimL family protein N-acetyltransferase